MILLYVQRIAISTKTQGAAYHILICAFPTQQISNFPCARIMSKKTKENKVSPKKPKPNMKNPQTRQAQGGQQRDGYHAGGDKVHVSRTLSVRGRNRPGNGRSDTMAQPTHSS
jgi:hypothetical protein